MSGECYLYVGVLFAGVVAILQIPKPKNDIAEFRYRLFAGIFALVAALLTLAGTLKEQSIAEEKHRISEAKLDSTHKASVQQLDSSALAYQLMVNEHNTNAQNNIQRIHSESEKKTDYLYLRNEQKIENLHGNYTSDLKETYGFVSRRTTDQFIAEKVPNNLSEDAVKVLIRKAITKWLNDSIISKDHLLRDDIGKLTQSNASQYEFAASNLTLSRNYSIEAQNIKTFWDAYFVDSKGPGQSKKYIHVIVNSGKPSDKSVLSGLPTEQARELYYKYGKWFESITLNQYTHDKDEHLVIFIFDTANMITSEELIEEMALWAGNSAHLPSLNWSRHSVIVYNQNDLKSEKPIIM